MQKICHLTQVTCLVKLVLAIQLRVAYTAYYIGWHPILVQPQIYLTAKISAQLLFLPFWLDLKGLAGVVHNLGKLTIYCNLRRSYQLDS